MKNYHSRRVARIALLSVLAVSAFFIGNTKVEAATWYSRAIVAQQPAVISESCPTNSLNCTISIVTTASSAQVVKSTIKSTYIATVTKTQYTPGESGQISVYAYDGYQTQIGPSNEVGRFGQFLGCLLGCSSPPPPYISVSASLNGVSITSVSGRPSSGQVSSVGNFNVPTTPGTYAITLRGCVGPLLGFFGNTTSSYSCDNSTIPITVIPPPPCTLPWGGTIASGSSVTAYNASLVLAPAICSSAQVSQTRVCTNGVLSGSYTNQSCAVESATISVNPLTVDRGQATKVTWSSTNATSCTAIQGNFSTGGATSGTVTTGKLSTDTLYQIACTGQAGTTKSNIQQVTVFVPTVSLSAVPTRVGKGKPVTLNWDATNINSCTLKRNGSVWKTLTANAQRIVKGTTTDIVNAQTIYKLTCVDNASVSTVSTQIVNVAQTFRMF